MIILYITLIVAVFIMIFELNSVIKRFVRLEKEVKNLREDLDEINYNIKICLADFSIIAPRDIIYKTFRLLPSVQIKEVLLKLLDFLKLSYDRKTNLIIKKGGK